MPPFDLGEFELINRYFAGRGTVPPGGSGVILGIGDDAALLELPPGSDLVCAVDTIVAGRHFLEGTDARSVGHRALAVNLSDMAAMGAVPAWATLALTLPAADAEWLAGFSSGLFDLAAANAVTLVGGDTTCGPLTVSIQILGSVPKGTALRRSGAAAGDWLCVSGSLGDAGAGLHLARTPIGSATHSQEALDLIHRFEYPSPRVQLGLAARSIASAAMDVSDGLAGDLPKLARASGLGAHVQIERLPLSDALKACASLKQARDWALCAGDDYELLLAVAPPRFTELQAAAHRLNLTLTAIGELDAGSAVTWSLHGEKFLPRAAGYEHFGRASTQITV